ncbi:VOC family protein [Brevundimonas faecalis]|uniref:3-demethylubiquinone-9 3-methyltransferase (Glyoxalase superfamily) n=1 Tax=Brevundimonas faecalis TaxID=947378 RepID=A0ABV2R771_9CAUL
MTTAPFLMFQNGRCRAALDFYAATLPDTRTLSVQPYPEGTPGGDGLIMLARVSIDGLEVIANDSTIRHAFDFTPSTSFFHLCRDAAEVDRLADALSDEGAVLMPPGDYGFSRRFAWVNDRFGVSWQLNFE